MRSTGDRWDMGGFAANGFGLFREQAGGSVGSSSPLSLVGPRVSFFVSWLGGMF